MERVVISTSSQYRTASGLVPVAACPAPTGTVGIRVASRTNETSPTAASTRNAERQPACWPSHVPAGTPSIGATAAPMTTMDITRPRTRAGNRPAAAGATTDQNTAWLSATTIRAASSIGYEPASADTT